MPEGFKINPSDTFTKINPSGTFTAPLRKMNIPKLPKRIRAQTLKSYREAAPSWNAGIIGAYKSDGYTQKAIGEYFGVTHSMVSKIINAEGMSKWRYATHDSKTQDPVLLCSIWLDLRR